VFVVFETGRRGPKRGHGGRHRGGRYPEEVRAYWRRVKREYRRLKRLAEGKEEKKG